MDSILNTIKKMLGIEEDDIGFDVDVIPHINSVFFDLNQLGVGPDDCFYIDDAGATWDDFVQTKNVEAVKSYMYLRVKLLFDPPANSSTIESYNKQIEKMEWRLNVAVDPKTE